MGWLYSESWGSPSAMRDHLRYELKISGYEIVKDALVAYGHRYYAAVRKDGVTTIFVALINGSKSGGYGYKDLSETMGPCDVDCPLSVLDAADPIDVAYADWPDRPDTGRAWARDWRAKVRAHWAAKAASRTAAKGLKPGDKVWVKFGAHSPYEVASVGTKVLGYGTNGMLYRLPKGRIDRVESAS